MEKENLSPASMTIRKQKIGMGSKRNEKQAKILKNVKPQTMKNKHGRPRILKKVIAEKDCQLKVKPSIALLCKDKPELTAVSQTLQQRVPLQNIENIAGGEKPAVLVAKADHAAISVNSIDTFLVLSQQYRADIANHLRKAEVCNRPKPGYMWKQPSINHSMRTILVDWLADVCDGFQLQNQTLHLAVSYIDRYLSLILSNTEKLQLVGTVALLIAAKYEEIVVPRMKEFLYITEDDYTRQEMLRMEKVMLKALSYNLTTPTSYEFAQIYCSANGVTEQAKFFTMYLCEIALLDGSVFLSYLPSMLSAGAFALALYIVKLPLRAKEFETHTGYQLQTLKDVTLELNNMLLNVRTMPQQVIREKYTTNKYLRVAIIESTKMSEKAFNQMCEWFAQHASSSITPD